MFATFTNLFGNIVIFLPFGFFCRWRVDTGVFGATASNSLALSLLVETFQLLTKVGCFDVDDLLSKHVGGNIRLYYIRDMQYDKEKIQCEKKRKKIRQKKGKKRVNRKYGQAKLKHSKKGIQSCVIAGIVLVALAAMIVVAYISAGAAAPYIGGMALVTLFLQ